MKDFLITIPFLILSISLFSQVDADSNTIENDTLIYTIVENSPQFIGGDLALNKYIENHLILPKLASELNIPGRVYVSFVVEKTGEISNTKILRGIGYGCDEEAFRLVSTMPNWSPGSHNGKLKRVRYNLPISFVYE